LAVAPGAAGYWSHVVPGFVILGFGVGLVFPAASIATLSEVGDDTAGLASGLIATGHELAAAFGVAAISAVATSASTFVGGYEGGFAAVAAIGGAAAAISLVAIPTVRPGAEVA
jgi:hypothetical protein